MDAFFASVEQRDKPSLRNKAIAVGGEKDRGVVAAASYEARKYGVRSAMPSVIARQKCPHLIFVAPRFEVYKSTSLVIKSIYRQYSRYVEPLSLDEAYLDLTESSSSFDETLKIALSIKEEIFNTTELTASAGISYNKFLAKMASDIDKPNGHHIIQYHEAQHFLDELAIASFYGIGEATASKMKKLGIKKGKDLRAWKKEHLIRRFGKIGLFYFDIVRGIDNRAVISDRVRKSIGVEQTFEKDITDWDEITDALKSLAKKLEARMQHQNASGYTLTLKVKFSDFNTVSKQKTLNFKIINFNEIFDLASLLLTHIELHEKAIRLLGLSINNLNLNQDENNQLKFKY